MASITSLYSCSSKAQPLLLTWGEGCLLTAAPPDLERGVSPLSPPVPSQPPLHGRGVAPLGCHPGPQACGRSSPPLPLISDLGQLLSAAAPDHG